MRKKYYFLAGLPRSGSTLLSAILSQNPEIHATATSTLSGMFLSVLNYFGAEKPTAFSDNKEKAELLRVLSGILGSKYSDVKKPIILDKSREWSNPDAIELLTSLLGEPPKIVATVRDVPDCASSFYRLIGSNLNEEEKDIFFRSHNSIVHLEKSYRALYAGYKKYPECFLFIRYEDLIKNPKKEMGKVDSFLGLKSYSYNFDSIDGSTVCEDDKNIYGVDGVHLVRPVLKKLENKTAKQTLGHYYEMFDQPSFWDKTALEKPPKPLTIMLNEGLIGNFDKAKKIGLELIQKQPKNNRAAFNCGWYTLRDGHLLDGMKFIDRGRVENVFGNPNAFTSKPKWDGKTKGTVLLFLEGGLGDQIHGARFIKPIADKGCKVVVSCSPTLFPIINQLPEVTAICQEEAARGICHDFYVQSMSAAIPLKLQYADVKGSAYIPRPKTARAKKIKIGLRWQGNPEFEHQQHRLFPSELLFNAVEGHGVEFISLQRDEGSEHRPKWVKEVCLDSWEDTQKAVSSCDLVISSCTSVAHLSAAMGVETWVVVPILPYYLWAKPGDKTEWYNSVSLYRQTEYGNWGDIFLKLKKDLTEVLSNADYKDRVLGKDSRRRSFAGLGLLSFGRAKAS